MAKKSNFVKNLTVGGKAIIGSILHSIIMMIIFIPVAFFSNAIQRPIFWVFVGLAYILTGLLVLGWIYRILWKWK